ncbi:MAG: hypothetical protein M1530_03575 [Candidatus Marsarchaeota archaeon]|nr:hypothetical protein [Candidatus Marsarchaeota archaeon]
MPSEETPMAAKSVRKRSYDHERTPPAAPAADARGHARKVTDFFGQVLELALHPDTAAARELGEPTSYSGGLFNLIPSFVMAFLFFGLLVLAAPPIVLAGQPAPSWAAWLFGGVVMSLSYVLMALIVTITVYLMARLAGGTGRMEALWHLVTKLMVLLNVLWLVAGLLSPYLPGIKVGGTSYSVGQMAVDLYFVWALALMLPCAFGLSKNRAFAVSILFWALSLALSVLTSGMTAAATG